MTGVHKPSLDGSQLAALVFETLLNGYFHVLLIQCLQVLYERSRATNDKFFFKPMTITALVLFVTVTGHWIVDVITAFEAFVYSPASAFMDPSDNVTATPAQIVYLNLADPKSLVGSGFYLASTMVGDSFMIYRLYIVWSRSKLIIIPPILLCLALAASGAMVTFEFSQANHLEIFKVAGPWITTGFTLTFICNLYSTSLIALRIFLSNKSLVASGAESTAAGLKKVIEIIIESAALYSCCVLLALATYASHSNVQFVFVAVTNAVIGIIFCMIVTRSHNITRPYESPALTSISVQSRGESITNSSRFTLPRQLAIKVTKTIEVEGDAHHRAGKDKG